MSTTCCCFATVPESSVGIVEKFGKFKKEAGAGLHWLCCCLGEQLTGAVSLRVQQLDVNCETKTKDNVFVTIVVSVQYQVTPESVFDAHYRLTDPQRQITAYVYDVVRASVPKIDLDSVFETKEDIASAVKAELEKVMAEYGYQIVQALITDIVPDSKVKAAMNEINAAERLRIAATDKAEAEKIMIVKAAEADAESKYLAGVGVSRQRRAIVEGLKESILGFSEEVSGTTPKDVMDLVIITQYFDTLRDIGAHSHSSTVFIPHSPAGVESVAEQIRNGFMQSGSVGQVRLPKEKAESAKPSALVMTKQVKKDKGKGKV